MGQSVPEQTDPLGHSSEQNLTCQKILSGPWTLQLDIVLHCFPVSTDDYIVSTAWIYNFLHSSPVSCYRVWLSREPIGVPNRLLIGINCLSVVA